MSNAIVTERSTKYYGRQRVVDDLSLRVPYGTVYGLLGRNGAGKSTTIKMLLGLVHFDRGRSELLSEDSAALSPAVRARIAYLAEGRPRACWRSSHHQTVAVVSGRRSGRFATASHRRPETGPPGRRLTSPRSSGSKHAQNALARCLGEKCGL